MILAEKKQLLVFEDGLLNSPDNAPVVIVGNGPAGMQAARALLAKSPRTPLVIYGEERHQPYNRVQLSSVLAGDVTWDGLTDQLEIPWGANAEQRLGCRVVDINPGEKWVLDDQGQYQAYSKLILSTGSRPFIPRIQGSDLYGVFTFRYLDDATALLARRVRSRHTVIIGGGLLGLEAARGMQRYSTRITVIEHSSRLMASQLDQGASDMLSSEMHALGVDLKAGVSVATIEAKDSKVSGIMMNTGERIVCDTVIIATGIRPNVDLAKQGKLAFAKGIRVDDNMCSSMADIYAIGECAEHRDRVYGLVAPGLEQAGVAVSHILGEQTYYHGSLASTKLKVAGCQVFSMGPMGEHEENLGGKRYHYVDKKQRVYRTLLVKHHRLIGAVSVGEWQDVARLQSMITNKSLVWPWQIWRFMTSGSLWVEDDASNINAWPAQATVCQCKAVSRGQITTAIEEGATSLESVRQCTGASSVCGSCKPLIENMLGDEEREPVRMHRWLFGFALFSFIAALAFLLLPNVPYSDSVQAAIQWDVLWRDGLIKQITGFTILGLFVVGLLISPRKRMRKMQSAGQFDIWRLFHIVLGGLVVVTLLAHTGLRLGNGLNAILMVSFVVMLLLGAISTGVISLEHRISGALATRLRRHSIWLHIVFFWPVPVVLGFHVLKSYWY